MPSARQIRYAWKPLLFTLGLLPLAELFARAFGLAGLEFGPNPVEEIQDTLGIWGLRFILATLAMTPLQIAIGKPWPLRFRRMLGLFAYAYTSLHFLNYLVLDQTLELSLIVEDVLERPFITLGFTALVLLTPLAITSTRGWQRRLGRRWSSLHRLVYPAAILGCWHFYWQVKEDVTEPLIYVAILAALLGVRIWRRARRQARAT